MNSQVIKRITRIFQVMVIILTIFGLVACSKRGGGSGSDDMGSGGVEDSMRFYGSGVSPEQERQLLAKRVYYFGYDSFEVGDNDTLSIYAHAKRLSHNPNARVRVEGHTDERGSREYNVALGERRAKSVANILMLKGASQNQISVVSYGKEKPAIVGHEEDTWSQNRRAVIEYESE